MATAQIVGVVTTDEPRPRPLRRARVTLNGESLRVGITAITRDDGSFAFTGLAPGRYELIAAKDAYVTMRSGAQRSGRRGTSLTLAASAAARVSIALPRGAVVTGTILDVDGQPAQGIVVTALERRFAGGSGENRYVPAGASALPSDDRGTYRIYGLPAGEYLISAQSPAWSAAGQRVRLTGRDDRIAAMAPIYHPSAVDRGQASPVTVAAGEERGGIDVQLQYVPLASVSGTAVAPPGWRPAEVSIGRAGDSTTPASSRTTRANDAGAFFFTDLPPGAYRILARSTSDDKAVMAASADITLDGDDVQNLALSLQRGVTIGGLIVFRGDTPPPVLGTSLSVPVPLATAIGNATLLMPPLQIDGVRFRIDGVIPGAYRVGGNMLGLRTPLGGWWLQSISARGVEVLDAPIEFRQSIEDAVATFADKASEVSGTVRDEAGRPLGDVMVVAFPVDRSAWFFNSRRIAGVRANASGGYSIRNLPPGDYRLVAAIDLEQGEWFDPALLERLLPSAAAVTVTGTEKTTIDLVVRRY